MLIAALLLQAAGPSFIPTLPPPSVETPAPATPSPEALALAGRLAATGMLATLLPLVVEKDLAELAAEPKDATPEQRARIVATGRRVAAERSARLLDLVARGYASRLSVADLRTLVAAAESPAAARKRVADLPVIAAAMRATQGTDLKREVAAAACAEYAVLCRR